MKTAVTVWKGRVASVFDTARDILLVESAAGKVLSEDVLELPSPIMTWLLEQRVDAVICGAISRPLHERLTATGVRVVPFVAGDVREVVRAWLDKTLGGAAFTLPGCCGQRRMRRGCCKRSF